MIASYWRLRRLGRVEAGISAWQLLGELARRAYEEADNYRSYTVTADLAPIISDREKFQDARSKAREIEGKQEAETAILGGTVIRDAEGANSFSKLSCYEAAIERSLYRALHELQRLQATRLANTNVRPLAAIDIDVTGLPREKT